MPDLTTRALLVAVASQLAISGGVLAQDLAESLRAGGASAVTAALAVIDQPSEADLNGLLALLKAGQGRSSKGPQAAELAYAVVGWWSILDAGIANGLLDRYEQRDWPQIQQPLLELATMGATDGAARATRWLASEDESVQNDAFLLLRRVGGDRATIDRAIQQVMASPATGLPAALALIWEFQHASEDLREQLEGHFAQAKSWPEKLPVLWAMVRGGAFQTEWLLAQWRAGSADQRHDIDYAVGQAVTSVSQRFVRELHGLSDDASRQIVVNWLESSVRDGKVRDALLAVAADLNAISRRMVDVAFARALPVLPELLDHWSKRLAGNDPQLQRVACQALIRYRGKASANVDRLIALLKGPQAAGSRLHGSAILALASMGVKAIRAVDVVKKVQRTAELPLAEVAGWAVPRILGDVPYQSADEQLMQRLSGSWRWRAKRPLTPADAIRFAREIALDSQAASGRIHDLVNCLSPGADAVPAMLLAMKHRQDSQRGWVCIAASKLPEQFIPLAVPRLLRGWSGEQPCFRKREGVARLTKAREIFANLTTYDVDRDQPPVLGSLDTWADDLWAEWRLLSFLGEREKALIPLLEWMAPRRTESFRASVQELKSK